MSWQPIETAPKDGTEIDLWVTSDRPGDNGGYRVADCWWSAPDEDWRGPNGQSSFAREWTDQPTHWMPIPEGPKP